MPDIQIERKLAVINGFVSIPDGGRTLRTSLTPDDVLTLIPGSELIQISGDQRSDAEYIKLPVFDAPGGPPEDWFATCRAAAS